MEQETDRKSRGLAGIIALLLGTAVYCIAKRGFAYRLPGFWIIFCGYFAVYGIIRFILGIRYGRNSKRNVCWLLYGLLMLMLTVDEIIVLFETLKAGTL